MYVVNTRGIDECMINVHYYYLSFQILKYFKNQNGSVTFETFLRALKWCETQELREKARGRIQTQVMDKQPCSRSM